LNKCVEFPPNRTLSNVFKYQATVLCLRSTIVYRTVYRWNVVVGSASCDCSRPIAIGNNVCSDSTRKMRISSWLRWDDQSFKHYCTSCRVFL